MRTRQVVELDQWLENQLALGQLNELKAKGRTMSLSELLSLGRRAAAT